VLTVRRNVLAASKALDALSGFPLGRTEPNPKKLRSAAFPQVREGEARRQAARQRVAQALRPPISTHDLDAAERQLGGLSEADGGAGKWRP